MIYPQAIMQTVIGMGPIYFHYIFTWVKMAVWDAPYRVWLDIELEKISIERDQWKNNSLYPSDDECDETPKSA